MTSLSNLFDKLTVGVYVISFIWEIGKGIRNTARDIRTSRAMIAAAEAERQEQEFDKWTEIEFLRGQLRQIDEMDKTITAQLDGETDENKRLALLNKSMTLDKKAYTVRKKLEKLTETPLE